jgi:hypothetical protein
VAEGVHDSARTDRRPARRSPRTTRAAPARAPWPQRRPRGATRVRGARPDRA